MIEWREGSPDDPHKVWQSIEATEYTIKDDNLGHWEIGPRPYRPNLPTRILARILLGWKWIDDKR